MEIKADVKSIESLKDYFFVVPDYQREYVWQAEIHVARFLQDIYEEFEPNAKKQSNYFIGSTIIVKRDDGAFDVVDGQQRLTTIVLALCATRSVLNLLKTENEDLDLTKSELIKVVNELLYKYDISSRKHTPRLFLQYTESKDYLNNLISNKEFTDKQTPSITKMMEAYQSIILFLEDLKLDGAATLINYVSYFLTNVEMVIIRPDNLGSALKIFETINERGVGLNAMDLLKNLLFSHASQSDFTIIKQTWKEMLNFLDQSVEKDKPLRFLRYFLMARYHDGIIREDEIYKWMISDEGQNKIKYKSNPVRFVKELKEAAAVYVKFITATTSYDADQIYPAITGIGYLSKKTSRQHLVLLLALKDNIDNKVVNLLARNIESLIFYYVVNRVLTKSYEEKFANWASAIRSVATIEDLNRFLQNTFKPELTDQQTKFNSQFLSRSQNELNPQYRVKYILGKIESYIRSNVNFPEANLMHFQNQQLEHIFPQEGRNIPKELFPNDFDYNNTVYRFGNLTLLEGPINQSLNHTNDLSSNAWFETKKTAYINSTILLTRTFSEMIVGAQTSFNDFAAKNLQTFEEWNMESVSLRQEMMRKLISQIWILELGKEIDENNI